MNMIILMVKMIYIQRVQSNEPVGVCDKLAMMLMNMMLKRLMKPSELNQREDGNTIISELFKKMHLIFFKRVRSNEIAMQQFNFGTEFVRHFDI